MTSPETDVNRAAPGRDVRRRSLLFFAVAAWSALALSVPAFARAPEEWSAQALAAEDRRALQLSREWRDVRLERGPLRPVRYNQLLGTGQSLMEAAEGWPAITRRAPPGTLMLGRSERPRAIGGPRWAPIGLAELDPLFGAVDFKGRPFTPVEVANFRSWDPAVREEDPDWLKKKVARGESPLIAAAASLAEALAPAERRTGSWARGDDPMVVASNAAVGGMSIAKLSKGGRPDLYSKIPDLFAIMRGVADKEGVAYQVVAQIHMQGEADSKDLDPAAKRRFKELTVAYRDDVAADATAATGQKTPPAFYSYQTGGVFVRDESKLAVGMAQWEMSREQKDWFLVGPVYQYPDKGGHLTANGNRWFGVKAGQALAATLVEGRTWRPLAPLWLPGRDRPDIRMRGRSILLPLDVPVPPVRFAPSYVLGKPTEFPARGFAAFVDGLPAKISRVSIAGEALILVELAEEPQEGASVELAYATRAESDGSGNVFDSDPHQAQQSYEYEPDLGMGPDEDLPELNGKPYPMQNALIGFWAPVGRD
jgi:hypothetical protein